jgi:hypothetical protein
VDEHHPSKNLLYTIISTLTDVALPDDDDDDYETLKRRNNSPIRMGVHTPVID